MGTVSLLGAGRGASFVVGRSFALRKGRVFSLLQIQDLIRGAKDAISLAQVVKSLFRLEWFLCYA